MAAHLRHVHVFRTARYIALYMPVRGEADPRHIQRWLAPHQQLYLPVLSPWKDKRLWFIRWDGQNRQLCPNRFHILEPCRPYHRQQQRAARWLDLVLTPLVAFDNQGNRLGMGGGYYDRTFAWKGMTQCRNQPCLLGYAYDFQWQPGLTHQPWDIRLDAVVTEKKFLRFGSSIY